MKFHGAGRKDIQRSEDYQSCQENVVRSFRNYKFLNHSTKISVKLSKTFLLFS